MTNIRVRPLTRDRLVNLGFIAFAAACAMILFVLFGMTRARASEFVTINPMQGGGVAIFSGEVDATAKIIHVPQDLSPDAEERARKWEAFCQPKEEVGRYGVTYLRYAHPGCEFGRTQ